MSDVVLVYPKSSFLEAAMNHFYIPLALLNSVIFVEKEFSVKIIDQRVDKNWKKHLLDELKSNPLCVAVSSLSGEQINYALEISKIVKENSNALVVWGGIHASILPEQTLKNKYIDIIIRGEGEISFYKLVKALSKNKSLKDVPGIWYRKNGSLRNNKPAKQIDLNKLPNPPYHLVNVKDYILNFDNKKMFIMETSRGCPNRCTFCFVQNTCGQKKWRALTPEKTLEKIKFIKDNFKVDGIEFQDLTSFVSMKRMKEIGQKLIKEKVNIFWNTCARINDIIRMDSEYLNIMQKSGATRLALGVETGSSRILKMIKKDITMNQVLTASKKLSKTNLQPVYSFMAGFPSETAKELKMTTDLIMYLLKENPKAKSTILHCYRPLPGTELFDLCVKKGLKVPKSLEEWGAYEMEKIDYPWLSKKRQSEISNLNFTSLFLDKKYNEIDDKWVQLFSKVYKPLAKYRFKNHNFNFMFEPYLKKAYVHLKK